MIKKENSITVRLQSGAMATIEKDAPRRQYALAGGARTWIDRENGQVHVESPRVRFSFEIPKPIGDQVEQTLIASRISAGLGTDWIVVYSEGNFILVHRRRIEKALGIND